jgi:flagellar L-ring protein precursor FlgH
MIHNRAASLGLLAGMLFLSACDTMDSFQKPPDLSAPGTLKNIPAAAYGSQPIAAANVDPLPPAARGALWRPGSKTFFRDPRARAVGDLLTVAVNLQEQAEFANQTNLTRTTSNSMTMPNLLGIPKLLGHAIPGFDPNINTSGAGSTVGQGDIKRTESIVVNVAATVVAKLPNGNFEIAGSQEIELNNEMRQLQLRGIVRPEDVRSDNTIPSEKIADARIEYGGRGVSSTIQRPTWGQDVLNRIQPF